MDRVAVRPVGRGLAQAAIEEHVGRARVEPHPHNLLLCQLGRHDVLARELNHDVELVGAHDSLQRCRHRREARAARRRDAVVLRGVLERLCHPLARLLQARCTARQQALDPLDHVQPVHPILIFQRLQPAQQRLLAQEGLLALAQHLRLDRVEHVGAVLGLDLAQRHVKPLASVSPLRARGQQEHVQLGALAAIAVRLGQVGVGDKLVLLRRRELRAPLVAGRVLLLRIRPVAELVLDALRQLRGGQADLPFDALEELVKLAKRRLKGGVGKLVVVLRRVQGSVLARAQHLQLLP